MSREQYRKVVEESFTNMATVAGRIFRKKRGLRYGRNPGQPAAFYEESDGRGACLGRMQVVQENPNKQLGFINLEDADAALRLMKEMKAIYPGESAATIMKHGIPTGVAKASTVADAFDMAWDVNSLAAFGGIVGVTDTVDSELADRLSSKDYFIEGVIAPGFSDEAKEKLKRKKDLRAIAVGEFSQLETYADVDIKAVTGGLLIEQRYENPITATDQLEVVSSRQPTQAELNAALFNWIVCGYVRSNAIVIGEESRTVGIGAGQQARIDAFELAVKYANERCIEGGCEGKVAASDAFFPHPDSVELAAKEGITAIVYTLGSIKDKEIIEVANKADIAMLSTGQRCFTHG